MDVVRSALMLRALKSTTNDLRYLSMVLSNSQLYWKQKPSISTKPISRQMHRCSSLSQKNTPTVHKLKIDKKLVPSEIEAETDIEPQGSSKQVIVKEKRRVIVPPLSEPEEEKELLPTHDTKRITPESRRLAQKASSMFDDLATERGATKEVFNYTVHKYISKETLYRRGAVEFIYAGLHEMKRFGVHRDLQCYKALLQAFPEGKMIPRNVWQVEFMHYPRQQQCGIDLLEQMEYNGVIPDKEFGNLLRNRFGNEAHVTRKLRRQMYWLPKFKNMNPYPLPFDMPTDPIELALLTLRRMCVDRETDYKVWKTADIMEHPDEDTFIASAQSRTQRRLLAEHDSESPLFVEGPFHVVSRWVVQSYFLLRAEPNINALMKQKQMQKEEEDEDNLFEWKNFFEEEHYTELHPILSVHEQDDSTVLGLCITGTSTKSSIVNWIRCLESDNPHLGHTPVLFQLISSPNTELQTIGDSRRVKDEEKNS